MRPSRVPLIKDICTQDVASLFVLRVVGEKLSSAFRTVNSTKEKKKKKKRQFAR